MRYRLRTLVILTIVGPPMLWAAYALLKPAGRLYWLGIFLVAFLICTPFAIIRLSMIGRK
jgi:hypothetical protein